MKKRNLLQLYYRLFSFIVDEPRIMPNKIRDYMKRYHKPTAASTYLRHLRNMYKKGISHTPMITLKPYLGNELKAYFCRKSNEKGLYKTFLDLHEDKRISYVVLLSGCDFLFMSRNKNLEWDLEKYGLDILKVSNIYTPVYTIPKGWNLSVEEALNRFMDSKFRKGHLERQIYRDLGWDETDWKIYRFMQPNIREKYVVISRKTGVTLTTVREHFNKKILPKCVIVHQFFPKGFDKYTSMVLKIRSKYEKAISQSLEKLPCMSIVFPLEREIILFLYHDNAESILKAMQKMEEIGIVDTYHLFNPLMYGKPD